MSKMVSQIQQTTISYGKEVTMREYYMEKNSKRVIRNSCNYSLCLEQSQFFILFVLKLKNDHWMIFQDIPGYHLEGCVDI